MSHKASDVSVLAKPLELGSPTINQLLNARGSATAELVGYLERECDAILECRSCRSLFRSLANFVAHKRAHCPSYQPTVQSDRQPRAEETTIILPTNPDTDGTRSANNKKRKPVRQTVPSSVVSSTQPPASLLLSSIDGVNCAVMQRTASDAGSASLGDSINLSEPDTVTVVQPRDGYANMSLRKRGNRRRINLDSQDFVGDEDDGDEDEDAPRDYEEYDDESNDTTFKPTKENHSSSDGTAKALAKRSDCDVKSLRCLVCSTSFSSIRSLNFHMTNSHGKQRKFYPCLYCGNVFSQFWGVTRHLKRNHDMTTQDIDRIREKIRARVFIRESNGHSSSPPGEQSSAPESTARTSDDATNSLQCDLCWKKFGKRQYLILHKVACSKKAAKMSSPSQPPKSNKPLLFVCKTCNRAFSMRQNMAQHAVACAKKHKLRESLKQENSDTEKVNEEVDNDKITEPTSIDEEEDMKNAPMSESSDTKEEDKKPPNSLDDGDEILLQLSPSDEVQEEEGTVREAVPETLLQSRPRRSIKPKQFYDGTIRIPEVVKIKQPDGSLVYKLREDVEASAVAPPSKLGVTQIKSSGSSGSKDGSNLDILVEGQSVPLLGPEDEAKIERMIDMRKLICLKCKKDYGSISNLRRHAVRHLGWRRFKCKLCKFTSYNKSECKTHLRKCHSKETATLLDYGLHPYIIDLGALLDDTCDDANSTLSITVPNSSEEKSLSSASPQTRSKAKEHTNQTTQQLSDCDIEKDTKPLNSTTAGPKRSRGRPRKTETSPSSINSASEPRQRGRPRKHPLPESDAEAGSQDETTKRPRGRPRMHLPDRSASSSPIKQEKPDEKVERVVIDPTKQKEQANKLEGLVSNIRNRIPMSGADNSNNNETQSKDGEQQRYNTETNSSATNNGDGK